MVQTSTEELGILRDPITTIWDISPVGGPLIQRYNEADGEYEPDRSLVPLMLDPSLKISDPNVDKPNADVTASLSMVWVTVTVSGSGEEVETVIVDSDDMYVDGKSLVVARNITGDERMVIRGKATYTHPATGELLKFHKDFTLQTETFHAFVPGQEVNVPVYSIVNPLLLPDYTAANASGWQRQVTARFFNGLRDISASNQVTFTWEKKDGSTYRPLKATDVEVLSISRNVMMLDLWRIGRCKYRVTAVHSAYPQTVWQRSCMFTIERKQVWRAFVRLAYGKLLKAASTGSLAEAVVTRNSTELASTGRDFRFRWSFVLKSGTSDVATTDLGWGPSKFAGRDLSGRDRTRVPSFRLTAYDLSEYQLSVGTDGEPVTGTDGEYLVGQVMNS